MTLTYGFYNSVSNDRQYDALQLSRIFDGIITDGVYAAIGNYLTVSAAGGMQVNVGTGRAWFNHTWSYNDAPVGITVPTAHATLNRIDVVYLEVNEDIAVRANKFDIVSGTPATTPVAPTLTNTTTVHQYPLAHIYVGANVSSILQGNITNKVGLGNDQGGTPFVTGPLSFISAATLVAQWEAEFDNWFTYIMGELDTEVAGNLQNQITAMRGDNNPPLITLLTLKSHDHTGGNGNTIPSSGLGAGSVIAGKIATGGVSATAQLANDIVDDTKIGNRVAKFYRRQGGSSTDWSAPGYTTYTPGWILEQGGARAVASIDVISFPEIFNYPPIVTVTIADNIIFSCRVTSVSASTFSVRCYDQSGNPVSGTIMWRAIGSG